METLRTVRAALDSLPPPAPPGVLFADHLHRILARCLQALEAEHYDGLVVHAGLPVHAFLDDQAYPYRVNPHFAWWVPHADAPGSLLHIRPGRRPRLLFVAPRDYWHAAPSLPREAWVQQFDVAELPSHEAALAALELTPNTAFLGPPLGAEPAIPFAAANPQRLLVRLNDHRTRKTAWETHQHRLASLHAARGHQAAAHAFRERASEREIHAAFLAAAGTRESELPYGAIVATGANAATLHYQRLSEETGPSLLIDAGAQSRGYASDITRTHSADDDDFAALVRRMDELQQSLCAAVRPGVDWRDLHQTAHLLLGEVLRDSGITRIEAGDAVDRGITRMFLPHGLGHLLGLQVHDVGGFQAAPDVAAAPPPRATPTCGSRACSNRISS